jgi:arsenate reductase
MSLYLCAYVYPDDRIAKQKAEFSKPESPKLDFIFTMCDNARKEVCPAWPRHPITNHRSVPDPAAANGTEEEVQRAFGDAFLVLDRQIELFLSLSLDSIDRLTLEKKLTNIGRT